MKLDCELDDLRQAVRALGDVWRDSHADAEGGVALSADSGAKRLLVRAANRSSYGQVTIPLASSAEHEIELILSAAVLTTLLRKLDSSRVQIEVRDGMLLLSQGGQRSYELNSLSGEVAHRPHDVPEHARMLDMDAVRHVGDLLVLCTNVGDMRTALGGVQLQWDASQLHLLASDSIRFAHAQMQALDTGNDADTIVPVRAFEWLMRTAKLLHASAAQIACSERWTSLRIGPAELIVPPQSGRFPPWRQIMPQDAPAGMVVACDTLLGAVQRIAPFAGHADVFVWRRAGVALELEARNSALGHASEMITPEEGTVGLADHASYTVALMASTLAKWPDELVDLAWPRGDSGPLLVRASGIEYLQMPLHTGMEV